MIKGSGQMRGLAWKAKGATWKVCCNYAEHGKRLKGGFFIPQLGCQIKEYVIAMLMGLEGSKNDGEIWPFRFIVPRRKKGEYEEALYPNVPAMNQDMDAATWHKADTLPLGPKMTSCDPGKAEGEAEFVKKATYSELSALVEEYEKFILDKVNSGAVAKEGLPASILAKLEEA